MLQAHDSQEFGDYTPLLHRPAAAEQCTPLLGLDTVSGSSTPQSAGRRLG
jgi:hypothetical protein